MWLILFLKMIFDMFSQCKVLQMSLGLLGLGACLVIKRRELFFVVTQKKVNWLMLLWWCLCVYSYVYDMLFFGFSSAAMMIILKLTTCFILFFLGQCKYDMKRIFLSLTCASIFVVIINCFFLFFEAGYEVLGHTWTFKGLYYYKLDVSLAALLSAVFLRETYLFSAAKYTHKIASLFLFFLCPLLIAMSNSRMSILAYAVFFSYVLEEKKYLRTGRRLKLMSLFFFTIKRMLLVFLFFGIFYMTPYARNKNFITVPFVSEFQRLVTGNSVEFGRGQEKEERVAVFTQGRSRMWKRHFLSFKKTPTHEKLLGMGIFADRRIGNDAHSSYIKIFITTGIGGILLFLIFLVCFWRKFIFNLIYTKASSDQLFIYNTAGVLMLIWLCIGLTSSAIIFTQLSWFVFFFAGMLFNEAAQLGQEK